MFYREIISRPNTNYPGIYPFKIFLFEIIVNAASVKMTDHG